MEQPIQTVDTLRETFGIPEQLDFNLHGDLLCAEVRTATATAVIALQGAHLVSWQPAGEAPVLFLSERSEFKPGKAIRGGIPVIWPWFGPRSAAVVAPPPNAPKSPSHGFARTQVWQLQFATLLGEDVHLAFTLAPSIESRAQGFDDFRLAYQIAIGRDLTLRLTTGNVGEHPLRFEEALHSYFAVDDATHVTLAGLGGVEFLDKTDGMQRKRQAEEPLHLAASTDRVYLATEASCVIADQAAGRSIHVAKTNSRNTVVWNPWPELTAGLADMAPEGWRRMLCVETANLGEDTITLGPGEARTMEARIRTTRTAPTRQTSESH